MRYSFCPNRSNHKLRSKRGKVEIKKSRNVWKDTHCCNQTWPLASSLLQKSPPLTNQAQRFQSPSHRGNPGADKRRHRCQGMLCASGRKRFPSLFKASRAKGVPARRSKSPQCTPQLFLRGARKRKSSAVRKLQSRSWAQPSQRCTGQRAPA